MDKPILIEDLGMLFPKEMSKYKARYGIYKCKYCENTFKAQSRDVKNGKTQSCGCYQKQKATKHGMFYHRLYSVWNAMMKRCTNVKSISYKNYGGRGIKVCERWLDIKNFIEDMDATFSNELSLDRIDNDKDYSKDNCRWTNKKTQSRNTRKIRISNTSGYRGVCFNKQANKWQSYITVNYKIIHLGYFNSPLEGARAYDNYIVQNNLEHTRNFS